MSTLVEQLSSHIEQLRALAVRYHAVCDDKWYSCPMAGEGCAAARRGPDCDCGATTHNAVVESAYRAAIAALREMTDEDVA